MKTAIVGHRGIGKTSMLKRFQAAYLSELKALRAFDLDREIETRTRRSIHDIFQTDGEAAFRITEKEVFNQIDQEVSAVSEDVVVVCGAGFDPTVLGNRWHVLWVRRMTDSQGKIFTDRPRLNSKVSALEEYAERFAPREARFAARANETILIDEGIEDSQDEAERSFILGTLTGLGGAITLLPEHFKTDFSVFIEKRIRWGISWFELRDDVLSIDEFKLALSHLPTERALLSFRDPAREEQTAGWIDRLGLAYDWPVERGECPYGSPRYLSLHERNGSLEDALSRFPKKLGSGTQLKAALPVRTFAELEVLHRWQMASASDRIVLPMSEEGRWSWYRLLRANDFSLNFIRESSGSAIDQPTLLQWARRRMVSGAQFAAVLGAPVRHSRSPMEHASYFRSKQSPVYAIHLPESEATAEVMGFLRELGLRWAAVTSPLKSFAFALCSGLSDRAETLKSVNTLVFDERRGVWAGTNTDYDGLKEAVDSLGTAVQMPIAVWGGGGTLEVIRSVLPNSDLFSVRTAENRSGQQDSQYSPKTVIWAVGRSRDLNSPPVNWKPEVILDLNYADDSPGRDYALAVGARYVSGLIMFRAQAAVQRAFWSTPR